MAFVVVERELPEKRAFEDLQAMEDAAKWCLDLHEVSFIRSYFSASGTRMICLYEAPDAESVRISQRKAGLPVDACYVCNVYGDARYIPEKNEG